MKRHSISTRKEKREARLSEEIDKDFQAIQEATYIYMQKLMSKPERMQKSRIQWPKT